MVLVLFFALVGAGFLIFWPAGRSVGFVVYTAVLVVLLIAVCWASGEPPRWRWGKK